MKYGLGLPPRVLILIPTRNRPELVKRAVESVLIEADQRLHIVVSDNSSAAARNRVRATMATLSTDAVYTASDLSMSEHWEWALSQALERCNPTHVGIVSDRFIVKPGALTALLDRVVTRFPDQMVVYNHDHLQDAGTPVRIWLEPGTGRVYRNDSQGLLDSVASGKAWNWETPRMMNCIVPLRVLEAIRTRAGRVFGSIAPDHYFGYWAAALEQDYLCWDASPLLHYAQGRSNGHAQAIGDEASSDAKDFAERLRAGALETPFPSVRTLSNFIFHEYAVVAAESSSPKFVRLDRSIVASALRSDVEHLQDKALRRAVLAEVGAAPVSAETPVAKHHRAWSGIRHRGLLGLGHILAKFDPSVIARWSGGQPRIVSQLRFAKVDAALAVAARTNRRRLDGGWPTAATEIVCGDVWP